MPAICRCADAANTYMRIATNANTILIEVRVCVCVCVCVRARAAPLSTPSPREEGFESLLPLKGKKLGASTPGPWERIMSIFDPRRLGIPYASALNGWRCDLKNQRRITSKACTRNPSAEAGILLRTALVRKQQAHGLCTPLPFLFARCAHAVRALSESRLFGAVSQGGLDTRENKKLWAKMGPK
jgi:hypothetical protein